MATTTVDFIGWAAIGLWIAMSIVFALAGNGDLFQRVGTLGIAAGVGYFAAIKWPTQSPVQYHASKAMTQAQILGLAKAVAVANNNVGLIARSIKLSDEREGKETLGSVSLLAAVDLVDLAKYDNRLDEQDARLDEILEASEKAETSASRVLASGVKLQAIVVVIATLQTGFVSLLFSNACSGATTC
jgi:hypothetical protein